MNSSTEYFSVASDLDAATPATGAVFTRKGKARHGPPRLRYPGDGRSIILPEIGKVGGAGPAHLSRTAPQFQRFGSEAQMHVPNTDALDPLLRYLWQYGATDLHLSAGGVPVRIDGKLLTVTDTPVSSSEFLDQVVEDLLERGRSSFV